MSRHRLLLSVVLSVVLGGPGVLVGLWKTTVPPGDPAASKRVVYIDDHRAVLLHRTVAAQLAMFVLEVR